MQPRLPKWPDTAPTIKTGAVPRLDSQLAVQVQFEQMARVLFQSEDYKEGMKAF